MLYVLYTRVNKKYGGYMNKKIIKNIAKIILCMSILIGSTNIVFAASNTYSSTYDMTGGVFTSKSFTYSKYISTTISPSQGSSGSNMYIYLTKKTSSGWTIKDEVGTVDSVEGGTVSYDGSGTNGIYLRNYNGARWFGSVSIKWK